MKKEGPKVYVKQMYISKDIRDKCGKGQCSVALVATPLCSCWSPTSNHLCHIRLYFPLSTLSVIAFILEPLS